MSKFLKFFLLLPFCLQANPRFESEGSEKSEETQLNELSPPVPIVLEEPNLEEGELDPRTFFESFILEESQVENNMSQLTKAAKAKQQEVEMLKAELDESKKLLEQVVEKGQKLQEDKTKLANKIRELKKENEEYKQENEMYKLVLGINGKKSLEERLENLCSKMLKKKED
ncbi:MAG: hypothetical protein BGO07_02505 [Alphaproteobacteria bacterium 40-19]|nr:MAG: hypothetical protein BGO07_02505 [Alphaproteobacteria bacterium 40-19]